MSSLTARIENQCAVHARKDFVTTRAAAAAVPSEKLALETKITIGGAEVVDEIFDEWTALCEEGASNDPFLRPEWFACFIKNFEKEILLLTVRRDGKLRAVLPLVRKNGKLDGVPVKKLQAVYNLNTQRFDLIHGADETERKEVIRALWEEVKGQPRWDVLEMRLVKSDSWLNDLLDLAGGEKHRTGIWRMDGAPFVSLPQGDDKETLIERYFKGLSKNRRQILGKKLRRLQKLGNVEFAVTRGYFRELMEKYFELEARSWKGQSGTAVTNDKRVAKLHDDFARAAAANDALFFYELKLDGKTIAMYISLMYDRQTVGWKMSFDEEYEYYSPGNLLFREVLSGCMKNDSPEIDQLCPATDYKKAWASGEREHVAFYVFRKGVVGTLLWKWKFSVIRRLRKLKNDEPRKA